MKNKLFTLLFSLISIGVFAQIPDKQWVGQDNLVLSGKGDFWGTNGDNGKINLYNVANNNIVMVAYVGSISGTAQYKKAIVFLSDRPDANKNAGNRPIYYVAAQKGVISVCGRLSTGAATAVLVTPTTVPGENTWIAIQRKNDTLTAYYSKDLPTTATNSIVWTKLYEQANAFANWTVCKKGIGVASGDNNILVRANFKKFMIGANFINVNIPTNNICNFTDKQIVASWGSRPVKVRIFGGVKWITDNDPAMPDTFFVRGVNFLQNSAVSTTLSNAQQSCFAGGNTGFGGLATPASFVTPSGYSQGVTQDGTPFWYHTIIVPPGGGNNPAVTFISATALDWAYGNNRNSGFNNLRFGLLPDATLPSGYHANFNDAPIFTQDFSNMRALSKGWSSAGSGGIGGQSVDKRITWFTHGESDALADYQANGEANAANKGAEFLNDPNGWAVPMAQANITNVTNFNGGINYQMTFTNITGNLPVNTVIVFATPWADNITQITSSKTTSPVWNAVKLTSQWIKNTTITFNVFVDGGNASAVNGQVGTIFLPVSKTMVDWETTEGTLPISYVAKFCGGMRDRAKNEYGVDLNCIIYGKIIKPYSGLYSIEYNYGVGSLTDVRQRMFPYTSTAGLNYLYSRDYSVVNIIDNLNVGKVGKVMLDISCYFNDVMPKGVKIYNEPHVYNPFGWRDYKPNALTFNIGNHTIGTWAKWATNPSGNYGQQTAITESVHSGVMSPYRLYQEIVSTKQVICKALFGDIDIQATGRHQAINERVPVNQTFRMMTEPSHWGECCGGASAATPANNNNRQDDPNNIGKSMEQYLNPSGQILPAIMMPLLLNNWITTYGEFGNKRTPFDFNGYPATAENDLLKTFNGNEKLDMSAWEQATGVVQVFCNGLPQQGFLNANDVPLYFTSLMGISQGEMLGFGLLNGTKIFIFIQEPRLEDGPTPETKSVEIGCTNGCTPVTVTLSGNKPYFNVFSVPAGTTAGQVYIKYNVTAGTQTNKKFSGNLFTNHEITN